jgi:hypothetical protein
MDRDHIPERDLASALRQEAGRELVEEAAEDEQLTEKYRDRQRELITVAEEAAHRGDRVTAELEGRIYSGPIVATGLDYVTVALSEQEAEIRVDAAVWSFVSAMGERTTSTKSDMRLRARLGEHAADGTRIRLELPGNMALMGTIHTVAGDHIRLSDADGRDVYIAMEKVWAVIRSTAQH